MTENHAHQQWRFRVRELRGKIVQAEKDGKKARRDLDLESYENYARILRLLNNDLDKLLRNEPKKES